MTIPETADRTHPYILKMGLYWLPTGERLPVVGQREAIVQIGTVTRE